MYSAPCSDILDTFKENSTSLDEGLGAVRLPQDLRGLPRALRRGGLGRRRLDGAADPLLAPPLLRLPRGYLAFGHVTL